MDLTIRIKKLEIQIHAANCDKFICTVSPDMYLTGVECATKFITAMTGATVFENFVWDFPIRPEIKQKTVQIPKGSGLRFSLYGSANAEAHRRHMADGVLYFHEVIQAGKLDGKHSIRLLDYGLMEYNKRRVEHSEVITRGELCIHIENVKGLLDEYLVEPANGFPDYLTKRSEILSAYKSSVQKFYEITPPLLQKYSIFQQKCVLYPSNARNGISEPVSLLFSVQQFVGPVYESVYLNGLLSSLWQLDITPLEFMQGARDRGSTNDKYSSGYVKSVQAAATMIPTIAHGVPYGYDLTAEGTRYDDPETQTMVREWDCEDGAMFSMRLLITLMRFKDIWRCSLVKEAANLLVRHYLPVLATTVCLGVPQIDKIDPDHREAGHILCILVLKDFFKKLFQSDRRAACTKSELIQWPEWMYYSEQYPPPPCCVPVFVENWKKTEELLLSIPSSSFWNAHESLKLSPMLALESTSLKNVCGNLKEFYPNGEQIWESLADLSGTPCFKWIQELHGSKMFTVSLNSPSCANNAQWIALNTRYHPVSAQYNSIVSLTVYSPAVAAKLDRALGRSLPRSIWYRNDTFVEACFKDHGDAGAFFSSIAIGDTRVGLASVAYLSEAACDCAVDAFLSNRPILHPIGKEILSVGHSDFVQMVGKRNIFSILLSPRTQQLIPVLPTISYVIFVDPETKEEFKNTIQKFIV